MKSKTPEMKSTEIGSLGRWSAQDAQRLREPAMYLGVCSKNSPADDITVEMKYVDPSVPPPRPKKLGEVYSVRMEAADEILMKKLCQETRLSKATILRRSCHAGLLAIDWSKFKRPVGAKVVVPHADPHPAISLRILRHGVPEQVFSERELGKVMDAIGTLSCFSALL